MFNFTWDTENWLPAFLFTTMVLIFWSLPFNQVSCNTFVISQIFGLQKFSCTHNLFISRICLRSRWLNHWGKVSRQPATRWYYVWMKGHQALEKRLARDSYRALNRVQCYLWTLTVHSGCSLAGHRWHFPHWMDMDMHPQRSLWVGTRFQFKKYF